MSSGGGSESQPARAADKRVVKTTTTTTTRKYRSGSGGGVEVSTTSTSVSTSTSAGDRPGARPSLFDEEEWDRPSLFASSGEPSTSRRGGWFSTSPPRSPSPSSWKSLSSSSSSSKKSSPSSSPDWDFGSDSGLDEENHVVGTVPMFNEERGTGLEGLAKFLLHFTEDAGNPGGQRERSSSSTSGISAGRRRKMTNCGCARVGDRTGAIPRLPGIDDLAISKPSQEVICSICLEVFRNPVITVPCGHVFCRDCIVRSLDEVDEVCPACKTPLSLSSSSAFPPARTAQAIIDDIRVRCVNGVWYNTTEDKFEELKSRERCEKVIQFSQLQSHARVCPYRLIRCHNCRRGCTAVIRQSALDAHLANCRYKSIFD
ncbi:hypothetical protein CBR_g50737 [Chara braunii]|uniref:RING-type domain-containing protein n=1 Tax=Chara braunii TaxID=69332 RepID=A0A388K5T3_CHABU|nr:hypothetical protein CBR_g50737 [Chara braunii]|eukprot:GBG65376.1 hypothetical protein CBR_g50737 [Chara braunii]